MARFSGAPAGVLWMAAAVLLGILPSGARAQATEVIGLSLAGGYYTQFGGDVLDDLDPGFGFVAAGRLAVTRSIVLGAGLRRSAHDVEGLAGEADLWGVFGEARLVGFGHRAYPFGGVRVGYARVDFDDMSEVSGAELAGLVGLAVPLMPGLALELVGVASFVTMDDSGSWLGLEAGLGFWFP